MPFIALQKNLDQAIRPEDKARAMIDYFQSVSHADAAWALHLILGKRLQRTLTPAQLKLWSAHAADIPLWLADESFTAVGDPAEAAALLIPEPLTASQSPLSTLTLKNLIEDHLPSLSRLSPQALEEQLIRTWAASTVPQRIVYNRLLLGAAGFKVSPTLIARTLAGAFNLSHAQMAARLTSDWLPTPDAFARLIHQESQHTRSPADAGHAYPFQAALDHSPNINDSHLYLDPSPQTPAHSSTCQWLYDGLRVQLIKRHSRWLLWSTGHQPVTGSFPELSRTAHALPDGTVIDAVIVPWQDRPVSYAKLLPRLEERQKEMLLWEDTPIMLIAFDLLEHQGQDIRALPLSDRSARLTGLITPLTRDHPIRLVDSWPADPWETCETLRRQARSFSHRGIILKPLDASYVHPAAPWLALKTDPLIADFILTASQPGPSGLYTHHTLSAWSGSTLVPVGKAHAGLNESDLQSADQFIRANITAKFGPVRSVTPTLVIQAAFESIHPAPRHKSGITLINPTLRALKPTAAPSTATTLARLTQLM